MPSDPCEKWLEAIASPCIKNSERTLFGQRISHFRSLWEKNEAHILSQVFQIDGFEMSAHFFPAETFREMMMVGPKKLCALDEDSEVWLYDYKMSAFRHTHCHQRNLHGETVSIAILPGRHVQGGTCMKLPAYVVRDGKFCPGIYHNLIAPEFRVSWDQDGNTQADVEEFRALLEKRATIEGLPQSAIYQAHLRSALFYP